jgi:hypothetical protein
MNVFQRAVLSVATSAIALASSLPVSGRPAGVQSSTPFATAHYESPFACDRMALSPEERKRHFDELGPKLRTLRKSIRELPDGYAFEFPTDAASIKLVSEWAAGERLCCPFFDIDLKFEREGGSFWMSLSGRDGVKQFIKSDFASWFK